MSNNGPATDPISQLRQLRQRLASVEEEREAIVEAYAVGNRRLESFEIGLSALADTSCDIAAQLSSGTMTCETAVFRMLAGFAALTSIGRRDLSCSAHQ